MARASFPPAQTRTRSADLATLMGQHGVVSPDLAAQHIRAAAEEFASGRTDIRGMWTALHSNLRDLCAETRLEGDFLQLFFALESWEASVGDDRRRSEDAARVIASRLAVRIDDDR